MLCALGQLGLLEQLDAEHAAGRNAPAHQHPVVVVVVLDEAVALHPDQHGELEHLARAVNHRLPVEDVLLECEALEEEPVLEHHEPAAETQPDFEVGDLGVRDVCHVEFEEVGEGIIRVLDPDHQVSVAVLVIGGDVWWNKDLLDDLASDVLGVAEE